MGPPAGSRPKDKGKEKERKTKNQKFEAVLNRRVLWDLQPAAGQKTKQKREGKPKIRNLRRY